MSDSGSTEILDCRNVNGRGWSFYNCDGVLRRLILQKTPEDDRKDICRTQNLKLRDDDVIVVAYPKCGTHWLWEIVTMIRAGRVEYTKMKKEVAMLGMTLFEKADELPSPRVLNSHEYFRHLPDKLADKKIKTIHMMRNPKDVCVSFYNHFQGLKLPIGFGGPFPEFVELFLEGKVPCGSYFDYIKDWQQVEKDHPELPLLTLYYEQLKKNPVKTIKIVAEFLEVPVSDEFCKEIAEACSFTKLKTVDEKVKETLEGEAKFWVEGHVGMYRKGEIGDWKNWLTVALNESFDDVIGKEMRDTNIKFVYE